MTQISSNDDIHKVLQTELGTLMSEYIFRIRSMRIIKFKIIYNKYKNYIKLYIM